MALLKGTDDQETEVKIKCVAHIPKQGTDRHIQVKFTGVYNVPVSDNERIMEIRERLLDPGDDYGDKELVNEFFVRFENMPGPDGGTVECTEEAMEEALRHRDYFNAIAQGCGKAVFGTEGRRKN